MKSTVSRRARHRFVAHEHLQSKNENKQNPTFFGGTYASSFFTPSRAFGHGEMLQPKCEDCEKEDQKVNRQTGEEEEKVQKKGEEEDEISSTPTFSERGVEEQNTRHYANCEGVSVEGFTDANYGNSFSTPGSSTPAKDCKDCTGDECVSNTGTVVSTFTTNPVVTLPSVPDGLSECEQKAVSKFINTTLNAHEQQHVAAFNTYRGVVKTPYTYKGCASGLDAHTAKIHADIESARKAKSDKKSAALDVGGANIFNIKCNCPDPEPKEGE